MSLRLYEGRIMNLDGNRVLRVRDPRGSLEIRIDARPSLPEPLFVRMTRDEARALAAELDTVADLPPASEDTRR